MVESIYKLTLYVLMLAVSVGFFFAVALFLAKESCSSNDNLCAPNNSSFYKTEYYACWKTCAPKTPRLNAKTCECSCIEIIGL